MGELVISYETLFELLRLERSRTELQQLPDEYSSMVPAFVATEEQTAGALSGDEHTKKAISVKNLLKIVSELYERRERKIVLLALDKVKTPASLVDFKKLLPSEKEFFEEILNLLMRYRHTAGEKLPEKKDTEKRIVPQGFISTPQAAKQVQGIPDENGMQMVRILSPFPSFVGPNLETYGPFSENDITSLPAPVAKLMIDKKRASAIRVNS
ncbi:MAG: hypothetical protein Q7S65_05280 [Nanoarchaeota archaeon]|nr:hypothetical protein [Nanoarchaeota archaeon]